ncbi:MAG: molybdopterin-binding protein [Acidianus infernus]|uniref:molybdopterin-binding protein n=1 Tax=Acidianus infernus TaxID=12915 RepID=UPI0022763109|nr:molybdopterin-binding protein [Acidianus infernus]
MKQVKTEEAVGKILGYDTTYVGKDGATTLLPRGHVITKEDVERLKDSGVYYVWIDEGSDDYVYEWDITPQIAQGICGENISISPGKQGSTLLFSKVKGVITIDVERLVNFNLNQNVLLITRFNYTPVIEGDLVGVVEVIPFKMTKEEVDKLKNFGKVIDVAPFKKSKIGLVITGTEIYEGRKQDQYYPVIKSKADKYGWSIVYKEIVPDDEDKIINAIKKALDNGAEAVIVTGGASVDPTDKTYIAIRKIADVISYGLPIKPTTMSIVAVWNSIPIFAISAGGIYYSDYNAIDVMFTRLMAGVIPKKEDIALMGHGGLLPNFQPKMKIRSIH